MQLSLVHPDDDIERSHGIAASLVMMVPGLIGVGLSFATHCLVGMMAAAMWTAHWNAAFAHQWRRHV